MFRLILGSVLLMSSSVAFAQVVDKGTVSLNCFVTTQKTVNGEPKLEVLGSDRVEITALDEFYNSAIEVDVNGEPIKVNGLARISNSPFGDEKTATVITRVQLPSKGLNLMDMDGALRNFSGTAPGSVATSSINLLFEGQSPISVGCSVELKI
jgi:hypothetical protein